MAQAGIARAVSPVNTPIDGDAAFCLATGARPSSTLVCGVVAAEMAAEAVRNAVRSAVSVRGVPTGMDRAAS